MWSEGKSNGGGKERNGGYNQCLNYNKKGTNSRHVCLLYIPCDISFCMKVMKVHINSQGASVILFEIIKYSTFSLP